MLVARDDNGVPRALRTKPDGTLIISGSGSTFIVDPAGAAGDNVFTSFAAAAAAAALAGPGSKLLIRGDTTVPAGVHDLTGVEIIGLGTITPTLTISDGATFTDTLFDFSFENIGIVFAGATAVISVPTSGVATITLGRYASIACTNAATAGFIATDGAIGVDMEYSNTISGSSGHQAIKLTSNGSAAIRVGNFGTITSNTITGGGSGAVEITDLSKAGGAAEAVISHTQTGLTAPIYD